MTAPDEVPPPPDPDAPPPSPRVLAYRNLDVALRAVKEDKPSAGLVAAQVAQVHATLALVDMLATVGKELCKRLEVIASVKR